MSETSRISDVVNIPPRGGLAIMGIPLDMLNPGLTTPPAGYDSLLDFANHRTMIWDSILYDITDLSEAGWDVDLFRGRAMINKEFGSFAEAQEAIDSDVKDPNGLREIVGNQRTIEWLAGGQLPMGGFILGEESRPDPPAFPLWAIAVGVLQAERVASAEDLKPALLRLGNRGALSQAQVAKEVAEIQMPIDAHIESFAGLGEIMFAAESWIEYLGRAEIPSGPPDMFGCAPWVAPYIAIPELCSIWQRGAMSSFEDVDLDDFEDEYRAGARAIIDSIAERVETIHEEFEARGGALKTPMSSEQETEVIMDQLQAMTSLFSEPDPPR